MEQPVKRAAKGFAFKLASMFAMSVATAQKPQFRSTTGARRTRVGGNPGEAGAKLTHKVGRGVGDGLLTCRHGLPYNDRETLMRLRALENGASVEIHRDDRTGKIIRRHVVWPKQAHKTKTDAHRQPVLS